MKALAIIGSPRKNGNTELLVTHTLKSIAEEEIDTEMIRLAGLNIQPCNACLACREEEKCPIRDDLCPIYTRMKEADAIILATPVYFGSATALLKALMERAGYISRPQKRFAGKVGGPLVVARRAGKNFTFAELMFWFQINDMIVPGSSYWNVAIGREKGEVTGDQEGMDTAWHFGKNVAALLKKLNNE